MQSARFIPAICVLFAAAVLSGCGHLRAYFQHGYTSTAVIQVGDAGGNAPAVATTEAVNRLASSVLSRAALVEIIRNFELYSDHLQSMPVEDVIELMRRDVTIQAAGNLGGGMHGMRIGFTYADRLAAQRVTQELVTRFIELDRQSNAPLPLKLIDPPSLPSQ